MPERVAQNERADRDPFGLRRNICEAEHRFVGEHASARSLDEDMVHHPNRVKAELLGPSCLIRDVGDGFRGVVEVVVHLQRHPDSDATRPTAGYFGAPAMASERFALSRSTRRRCVCSCPAAGFQMPRSTISE